MVNTVVETNYGKVQGEEKNGVYVWKGIPYAAPPVGSLRFRAPKPPEPWAGVREARQFSPRAPQRPGILERLTGESKQDPTNEDCLYLNIWSPGADEKRRPVMVWIHGGGLTAGSGSDPKTDGTSFAKQGDVVVVTLNYRLGALGFLHLKELGGEEYAASGNAGLLDQIEALKWIKENIGYFGGDPGNITVFGVSAGAWSAAMLLTMPLAQGLFQRAILQSGLLDTASTESATKVAEKLLQTLEIKTSKISKLEALPADKLIEAASSLRVGVPFQPVVDGVYLPKELIQAFASGCAKDIPLIVGSTKDESRLFAALSPRWNAPEDEQKIKFAEKMVGAYWPQVSEYYLSGGKTGEDLSAALLSAMTMAGFTHYAIRIAECQVRRGGAVWMYRFDWESPMFDGKLKASHAFDVPIVFNNVNEPSALALTGDSPLRQKVADQMHRAWIAFARSGNPNHALIPEWRKYDESSRSTMIFDVESKIVADPNREERIIWESVSTV